MGRYKQLLVAVDFSEPSIKALQTALEVSRELQAGVSIVHFVPMRIMDLGMEGGVDFIEEVHQKELAEAGLKLEKFISEHAGGDAGLRQFLRTGEPAVETGALATEIGADMIVIGTHGRSGLKHLLLGSVAESILKSASVPVLCVRSA
jgi:nucleotide-binding universal stress UspA family protein